MLRGRRADGPGPYCEAREGPAGLGVVPPARSAAGPPPVGCRPRPSAWVAHGPGIW